jgi:hypothetical protein
MDWLLDRAENLFGRLDGNIRNRIKAYCDNPTPDSWDDIQGIIVTRRHMGTIWQAVLEIDPTFPHVGRTTDAKGRVIEEWNRIPAPFTVLRAIDEATKRTA